MAEEGTNGHPALSAISGAEVVVQPPANPELVERVAHQPLIQTISNGGDSSTGQEPVKEDATTLASRLQHLSLGAQTVHADDFLNSHQAVAPPMHVSTTYRYSRDPEELKPGSNISVRSDVFSRSCFSCEATNNSRFLWLVKLRTRS
jgi:hypothetical protein